MVRYTLYLKTERYGEKTPYVSRPGIGVENTIAKVEIWCGQNHIQLDCGMVRYTLYLKTERYGQKTPYISRPGIGVGNTIPTKG